MSKTKTSLAFAALATLGVNAVAADAIPYPTAGTQNPVEYSFVAATTGDIWAYFLDGGGAGYTNTLSIFVNGAAAASSIFDNHTTTYGTSVDVGHFNAGDKIVFQLNSSGGTWSSVKSANADGVNHVYSTSFSGSGGIPSGVYVAFEDQYGGGDFNYNDLAFSVTNVATVPEPETYAMLLAGLGIVGAIARRRKRD